jgi:hypothetical protein
MALLAMTEIKETLSMFLCLLIFDLGSVAGKWLHLAFSIIRFQRPLPKAEGCK